MNANALTPFAASPQLAVAGWLITYAIHSTILLGIVWLISSRTRLVRSDLTRDILWKTALIGGIITASLQFSAGIEPLGGRLGLRTAMPARATTPADAGSATPLPADLENADASGLTFPAVPRSLEMLIRSGAVHHVNSEAATATIGAASAPSASLGGPLPGVAPMMSPVAIRRPDGRVWFGTRDAGETTAAPSMVAAEETLATPALSPATGGSSNEAPVVLGSVASSGPGSGGGAVGALVRLLPSWPLALVGIWLAGAVFGLARFGFAYRRVMRRIGERCEVSRGQQLRDTLRRLAHRAGIARPIALTCSSSLSTPIALGRSEICVPDRALDDLAGDQQEGMLAHELAHLVRRDPAWLLAAGVVESVFWFQPLLRVARRQMQDNSEYICDDWAVTHTGRSLPLAKCLAEVGAWVQSWQAALPIAAMARRDSALVCRVERLLDASRQRAAEGSAARRMFVAAAVVVFVVCLAPIVSADGSDPAPAPKAKKSASSTSATTVTRSSGSSGGGTITIRSTKTGSEGDPVAVTLTAPPAPAAPGQPSPIVGVWSPAPPAPPATPDPFGAAPFVSQGALLAAAPPAMPGVPSGARTTTPPAFAVIAPGANGSGTYVVGPNAFGAQAGAPAGFGNLYAYSVSAGGFGPGKVIGVTLSQVGEALAAQLGRDPEEGALVSDVQADMPAAKAGLQKYDIITAIDGTSPVTVESVRETIAAHEVGDTVEVTVLRRGASESFTVEIVERKQDDRMVQVFSTVPNMTPEALAEYYAAQATPFPDMAAIPEIAAIERLRSMDPIRMNPNELAELELRIAELQRRRDETLQRQSELLIENLQKHGTHQSDAARAALLQAQEQAMLAQEIAEREAARAARMANRADAHAKLADEHHRQVGIVMRKTIDGAAARLIEETLQAALDEAGLDVSGEVESEIQAALGDIAREVAGKLHDANIEVRIDDEEAVVEIDTGRRIEGAALAAQIVEEITGAGAPLDATIRRAVERAVKAAARDLRTLEFELDEKDRQAISASEAEFMAFDPEVEE